MRIHVLGVGSGLSRQYQHTSLVVDAGRQYTLVECPGEILRKLTEARIPVGKVNHVFISHVHGDHAGGLESLLWHKTFAEHGWTRGPRVHLYGGFELLRGWQTPHGYQEGIWGMLAPAMRTIHDPRDGKWHELKPGRYYVEHELDDDGKPHAVHNLEAEVYRAQHVIPSMAVKLSYRGRTLGYSGDTTFDPKLIAWLGDCDRILHEAGPGVHADPEKLAELPGDLKRRMLLIHYADDLPGSRLGKRMGIRFAREGRAYDV